MRLETFIQRKDDWGIKKMTMVQGFTKQSCRFLLTSFLTGILCIFLSPAMVKADPPSGGAWQLVWSDEFDSGSAPVAPNPNNWGYENGYVRNSEWQYYTNNIQNAYCKDGLLHIEAHKHEPGTYPTGSKAGQDGSISSASLRSLGKVEQQYGWLEMRARIDTRLGSWPAFWTLGKNGEWPDNGECDIMEYYKSNLHFNVAWWKTGDARWTARWDGVPVAISSLGSGWENQFHIWTMEWNPQEVKLYMDGVLYNTWDCSNDSGDSSKEGFQQPHYIILNQAIGGTAGGDASGLVYPTNYEIDWVRWYKDISVPDVYVNDNDAGIAYSGTWGVWTGNPGYGKNEHFSETTDSSATFTFTGAKVIYYGFKRNDLGNAEIFLDGQLVATVDCYAVTAQYFYPLYESPELALGVHTIKVRVAGTKNSASSGTEVIVDAFSYSTEGTPPAAPKNFSAAAGGGSILLNWDNNTEADFAAYNVYRSTVQGSYGSPITTVVESYYIDRAAAGGVRYYYAISAVDTNGYESVKSNEQFCPLYKGDLTIDGRVDMDDMRELSDGWQTAYTIAQLMDTANDWLKSSVLYSGGSTYYIDGIAGNDNFSGLTPQEAWKTLSKVNAAIFEPGDEILFKAGTSYTGQLKPGGNGAEDWPIIVDQYSSGSKPIINGTGYVSAVFLEGQQYWEINNLELINNAGTAIDPDAAALRYGVYLKAYDTGTRSHLYLNKLSIHDIFATSAEFGQGIAIESGGTALKTSYEDVRIENCSINNTSTHGIWLHHKNWVYTAPYFAYNKNILIRNNILENIGGPGIQPNHCQQMLIEYNTVESGQPGTNMRGRGSGFWNWHCQDVTVQHNVFMHIRGIADSCGAHVDIGNLNTTIQYNLSYDNAGGFVEILGDSYNTVYRYNISINDGWRVKNVDGATQYGHMLWLGGWTGSGVPKRGPFNTQIYNNTIYLAAGLSSRIFLEDTAKDAWFRNNIFYADGTVYDENPDSVATNMNFDYNLYKKSLPATLPVDAHGIVDNPLLVNPGGLNDTDYMLQNGSPAINTGLVIENNGGKDYWQNGIYSTPDRGFHEKE